MTRLFRGVFALAVLLCLGAGAIEECQPCEDPSQLFCERVDSTSGKRV